MPPKKAKKGAAAKGKAAPITKAKPAAAEAAPEKPVAVVE